MTDEEDFQPLPSAMGLEAEGDTRPEIRLWARQEREELRRRAFDDQILAALVSRYGDDAKAAARYWRLSRTVKAITTGRDRCRTVEEVLDYIKSNYEQ
jgi:hypothetical protein